MRKISAKQPIFVGIGELLWDLLPTGRALGGAPMNVARHAAQFGAAATAVSAIGRDSLGREIIERLHAMGMETGCVQVRREWPTGTVGVALDAAGVPTFTIHKNVAWDHVRMTAELCRKAHAADAVAFGSLAQRGSESRATIRAFLDATKPSCIRVFDINLRQHFYSASLIRQSLKRATVLKVNDGELPIIGRLLDIRGGETAVMRSLIKTYGLRLVVLTKGSQGSRMMTTKSDITHPGCTAKVVDTVGAGDAFTAATTMGLLNGMPLDLIQDVANHVAAYVCSKNGAMPLLPKDLRERLRVKG